MLDSRVGGGRQRPPEPVYSHSRSRTTSSNTFPVPIQVPHLQQTMQVHLGQPPLPSQYHSNSRRSPSVNTFSSLSSSGMGMTPPPPAYRASPASDLHRSSSNRSGGGHSSNSYVALLRKQKATVWSDRAQPENPQLAAAQRAAKIRANLEVVGLTSASAISYTASGGSMVTARTTTGLSSAGGKVAAKIRHHGKPGVVGYAPDNNYAGVGGVPLRLSATEVEGEDSDDDDGAMQNQNRMAHHRRTGSSGRSSTASGRRAAASLTYRSSGGLGSMGSAGGGAGRRWSPGDTPERAGSLVDDRMGTMVSTSSYPADETASGKARSIASGSSAERADNVPDLSSPRMGASKSAMNATLSREKSVKSVEELKRRGSVDERTMTLTGGAGKLFIANPD